MLPSFCNHFATMLPPFCNHFAIFCHFSKTRFTFFRWGYLEVDNFEHYFSQFSFFHFVGSFWSNLKKSGSFVSISSFFPQHLVEGLLFFGRE